MTNGNNNHVWMEKVEMARHECFETDRIFKNAWNALSEALTHLHMTEVSLRDAQKRMNRANATLNMVLDSRHTINRGDDNK